MRALTVRQPWASAMFANVGAKDIENRVWYTPTVETIAIHAGSQIDPRGLAVVPNPRTLDRDRGVVLGLVDVVGCHRAGEWPCKCDGNPWAMWPDVNTPHVYHWELEHPREFVTPIPAKGALKFWTPDPSLAYLIETAEVVL